MSSAVDGFDIRYQFQQATNAMGATHGVLFGGDFSEWLEGLAEQFKDGYLKAYDERSFQNLIAKEAEADAYFKVALECSALLYLHMCRIDFDATHPTYPRAVFLFAFHVGVLEARRFHRLKLTQIKRDRAIESRPLSQALEMRFEQDVLSFLDVREMQLHSKTLTALTEKLADDEEFVALLLNYSKEASNIAASTAAVKMAALEARKAAIAEARKKEKRVEKVDIPAAETPKIPTVDNLYRWLSDWSNPNWLSRTRPRLVRKHPTSRRSF